MENEEMTNGAELETPVAEAPAESETAAENSAPVQKTADSDASEEQRKNVDAGRSKPVKEKKQANGKGMSRTFKLVYYPVLALFALIMMVFSIIDGAYGYSPAKMSADYYAAVNAHIERLADSSHTVMASSGSASARDYIVGELANGGFERVDEQKEGDDDTDDKSDDNKITTVTEWASSGNTPAPTVTLMTSRPTGTLLSDMNAPAVVGDVTNVVAAVPSDKTRAGEASGAVVITVAYDSRTDSRGAGNAAFVANLIELLKDYAKSSASLENDLVVVFTESIGYSYGAYSFFDAFKGLGDAVSRATVGLTLDSYGNAGTLALVDVSGAGLDYLNAYTRISGTTLNASAVGGAIPEEFKTAGAVEAFGDIPVLEVAVVGGMDYAQSSVAGYEELSQSIVKQQSTLLKAYCDKFCGSAKTYGEADKDLAVFSYFDAGSVAYNNVASYVIGAIILVLFGATVAVLAVKKTFSLKKLFTALGVTLAVMASALAVLFAAYFLLALMLTGFGVLPIHAITQVRYFNAGILIAAMLLTLAAMFGFTTLYKKIFKITSSDMVRGNAALVGLAGAVMCFATPAYSYITCWLGLTMLVVLLVTSCLNGKLKEKFGSGFDRFFPYVIPVALCMPVVMTTLTTLSAVLPVYMLPVLMLVFMAMLGCALPYLDRTAPLFDKVAKKLPMRTQRVERVVTERVEDRAKKGKFTERTVKRVDKEKVAVNYKNYFGVSTIAVIGCVVALLSGAFGATFGKSITAPHAYGDSVYNDAIVYEWEKSGNSITQRLVVDDLIAYKYFRNAISDLDWDGSRYVKTITTPSTDIVFGEPNIVRDGSVYSVTTFDGPRSTVTLTIPSARSITKIKITDAHGAEYEYAFSNRSSIVLSLPYGFGDFTMEIEGSSPSTIEYKEVREVSTTDTDRPLANLDDWYNVLQHYRGSDIENDLRGGIVVKSTFSV